MGIVVALLPSPLLGPAVWQPVADRLSGYGRAVLPVPVLRTAPLTPDRVLRHFLDVLPAGADLVLVPHSNAGLYVPALSAHHRVIAYSFVDAGLPPRHGHVPLAPPGAYEFLREKADDEGLLPPWTQWWEAADVAPLFPSADVRRRVEREQQRLPLSYFAGTLPVPSGWDDRPGTYVAFGDTYADDRLAASRRGWPVTTLPGGHLHTLIDPERVAAEIDTFLTAVGLSR
ncbi:MAG TPA: hypothetical protein VFR67_02055 [Pilimelia sp.]|nr:hypothetical protein [Pilimelia sp.]